MRHSIICCLLIASLIFCSTNVCFANPLDPWSDVETQIVTSGVQDIVSDVDTIRVALSTLYSYLTNNGDGVIEGLLVLANRVSNIINTLDYYLPLQNSVLQNLYSFFAAPSGDTRDIWDLLSQISANTTATSTALNTTNSELLTIDSHIDGVEGSLTSIGSRLDTVNTNLSVLSSKYKWNDISNYNLIGISDDNLTYIDTGYLSGTNLYAKCEFNNIYSTIDRIFYIKIPIGVNNSNNLKSLNLLINNTNIKLLYYDVSYYFTDLYFYADNSLNVYNSFTINYIFDNVTTLRVNNLVGYVKYLSSNDYGFYDFLDHLALMNFGNNTSELTEIKNILIDIDNNSDFIQNNNDLQINVDIDPSVGQGVTGVISKIQDLLDFGVSLQEFLVVLNQFDNLQWFTRYETFTQVNQDPRYSPGYIDLYE